MSVTIDELLEWQADESLTVYLIDVRTRDEFARGHLRNARHVAGGQLVQNVERYLVTRNARVVLIDSDGVRATTSAAWLKQLGWSNVYTHSLEATPETEASPEVVADPTGQLPLCSLEEALDTATVSVLDCRTSIAYRRGHVPGAWFMTRANVENDISTLPDNTILAIHGDDAEYTALLADDLSALGRSVRLLTVNSQDWAKLGLEWETESQRFASEPYDVFFDAEDFDDREIQNREGRAYLEWEIGLVHQLAGDPGAPYVHGNDDGR